MNYHNIEKYSTLNGVGVRNILWVSGCSHACSKCHNPQTWNPNSGLEYDEMAHKELLDCLSDEFIDGLTLSGGECLAPYNLDKIYEIVKDLKSHYPKLNIWIYSGYTFEQILNNSKQLKVLKMCDVLVDGKFENDKFDKSLHCKGSSNQRVIKIKESLEQNQVVLYCE